jgi:alkaline phosphatase D
MVSSCITPNFPYRGPLHRRSIKGFDLLTDYLFRRTTSSVLLPPESETVSESSETPSEISPSQQDKSNVAPTSWQAEFMLFLGDFIYADVPLYVGDDKEAYRRLYRRNYQSSSFRKLYEKLREFTIACWECTLADLNWLSCILYL